MKRLCLIIDLMLEILVVLKGIEWEDVSEAGWTGPMMIWIDSIGNILRAVYRQALLVRWESA